jgi:hypothetical protein
MKLARQFSCPVVWIDERKDEYLPLVNRNVLLHYGSGGSGFSRWMTQTTPHPPAKTSGAF